MKESVNCFRNAPLGARPKEGEVGTGVVQDGTGYLRGHDDALAWLNGKGPRSVIEAEVQWQFQAR